MYQSINYFHAILIDQEYVPYTAAKFILLELLQESLNNNKRFIIQSVWSLNQYYFSSRSIFG